MMDGCYFVSFFSPRGHPHVFWGKVQCTTSLHGFSCSDLLSCPEGACDSGQANKENDTESQNCVGTAARGGMAGHWGLES